MSEAEQDKSRNHEPGAEQPRAAGAFQPAAQQTDASGDLSFVRLLEQLEAEGSQPPASAGVSQIFSSVPQASAPPPSLPPAAATEQTQPRTDAQAFAPSVPESFRPSATAESAGAFAPPTAGPQPRTMTTIPTTTAQASPAGPPAKDAAGPAPFSPVLQAPLTQAQPPTATGSAVSPSTPAQPQQAPQPEPAGEFTRIFTQLPTPRSAPPAILAEVAAAATPPAPPAPAPGEFTQFFQAKPNLPADTASLPITHAPIDTAPTLPALAAAPPVAQLASPIQPASPPPTLEPTALAPPAAQAFAVALTVASPPTFAPAPTLGPISASAPAFAPTPAAFAPASAAAATLSTSAPPREASFQAEPQAQPGAFTAFFQSAATPAPPVHAAAPAPASRPAQDSGFPAGFADPRPSQPAAAGGFTELLRTLSNDNPAPAPADPPRYTPASGSAFAPGTSKPGPDPFSPIASPAPQGFTPQPPNFSSSSFAPQPPTAPPAGAMPQGEFTQLMQTLQTADAKPSAAPAAQTPFFAAGSAISAQGESEFTRVMRTSAARGAEAPVPTFAPAPASGGAPAVGLPIAAPQLPKPPAPALPTAAAKTKLQAMMPLLLAVNGALLLLLIALAFVYLRHHR